MRANTEGMTLWGWGIGREPMGNANLAALGEGETYELGEVDPDRPTYDTSDSKQAQIVQWRLEAFALLKFPFDLSLELAHRRDISPSDVERRFLAYDCSHELAASIVL